MTTSQLVPGAFLPQRSMSEQERGMFVARRNRMFSLCTPEEQQLLSSLASWYSTVRFEFLAKPNVFSESYSVWFHHRYFSWANPRPNLVVLGLSRIHRMLHKTERWLGQRALSKLSSRIRSHFDKSDADALVAVVLFLRALPPEFGPYEKSLIEGQLDVLLAESLNNPRISAVRRFEALVRCAMWSYDGNKYVMHDIGLREHAWPLLLDVVEEDVATAIRLIDEHWNQTRPPQIFMTSHLHERPELAYRLAVKLKPVRVDFAADMLCALIFDASYQVKKLEQAAADILSTIIGSSCKLLAEWMLDRSWNDPKIALRALDHLMRYSDPQSDYWSKLAPEALAILKTLSLPELDQQLRLLAATVFYSQDSELIREASVMFKGCIARRLNVTGDWEWLVGPAISDVSQSLSILEDKVLSMRNPDIAACPNHPLLYLVDEQLEVLLTRFLSAEPATALSNLVALTLAISNENLVRKYHRILQSKFEVLSREYPIDAGRALKKLIQYCGYSQMDDEMYRKELCEQSFNTLLPLLESISSTDAAVARTGLSWSPRGDI